MSLMSYQEKEVTETNHSEASMINQHKSPQKIAAIGNRKTWDRGDYSVNILAGALIGGR